MKDADEIHAYLKDVLEEMFEVDPDRAELSARLYDDLDIDSIDAIDLIARLTETTGIKVEPEQFKSVETVQDVVDTIQSLLGA